MFCPSLARAVLLASLVCGCGGGSPDPGPAPPGGWRPPQILSFSPTAGAVGTTVLIEGILFGEKAGQNTVRFNGAAAMVQSASATEIVALVPSGATTGPIQVTTPGGSASSASAFTVLSESPIPGVAWTTRLQGPRGSVAGLAWDGKKLVTVGDSIQTSADVLRWDERAALTNLSDVGWNGQMFAAVGRSFSIYSSRTGLTWNRGAAPEELVAVASSSTSWVAVGRAGVIGTSADGSTWSPVVSPTTSDLRAVAWSGSQFVAVGAQGAIITSPDGTTWTARTSGTSNDITAVGSTSSLMVTTTFPSNNSPSAILTSPDGVTWTERARGLPSGNAIIHAAGRWVVAGDYKVVTSSDGITWSVSPGSVGILDAVVHTGEQYVAIGITGSSVGAAYTSADGQQWALRSSAQRFAAVARSSTDGRLVAVATSDVSAASTDNGLSWQLGTLNDTTGNLFLDVEWFPKANTFVALAAEGANQRIHTSVDGLNWTRGSQARYHGSIGASPTVLVNLGADLTGRGLATSDDGVTWTPRAVPTSEALEDVFWTGSQLVAVGRSGTIVTSPEGVVWTLRPTGATATLRGAAASPGLIVAVGDGGTILTSPDGTAWQARISGTSAGLRQVVWTGAEWVAVGGAGVAVRSTDGMGWTVQPTPYTTTLFGSDPFNLSDAVWTGPDGGRLVVIGTRGLIATSP
jgi:hypothetical protein